MTCSAKECICAKNSTCSCGEQPASKCTCEKASVENVIPEVGNACACGKRSKSGCTCGASGHCEVSREGEIDFTNVK